MHLLSHDLWEGSPRRCSPALASRFLLVSLHFSLDLGAPGGLSLFLVGSASILSQLQPLQGRVRHWWSTGPHDEKHEKHVAKPPSRAPDASLPGSAGGAGEGEETPKTTSFPRSHHLTGLLTRSPLLLDPRPPP